MSIDISNRRYGNEGVSYRWHSKIDDRIIVYDLKTNPKVGSSLKVQDKACVIFETGKNNHYEYCRGTVVGFDFKIEAGPQVKIFFPSENKIEEVSVCSICDWNENEERPTELFVIKTKKIILE